MVKSIIDPIQGDRIRLRLLTEGDLPLTLKWRNQDHIRRWFIHSDSITPEQHRDWFEQYNQKDNDFVFIIEELRSLCRPCGQIALYNIDWVERRAEFGRLLIGEAEARGKGLAKQATRLLLTHAFGYLKLDRVDLEVFDHNAPAIAIYEQCRFQVNGNRNGLLKMTVSGLRFAEAV